MHVAQRRLVGQVVALVAPAVGAAVAQEVLGGRDHVVLVEEGGPLALQPADHGGGVGGHDLGIFRIALVGSAPAVVPHHGQGRSERPVHAQRPHLLGRGRADPADEVGITRRAQADIVREERGSVDVVVAVHGVGGPHHRDADAAIGRIDRGVVIAIDHLQPVGDRGVLVAARNRAAAVLDAADVVAAHVVGDDRLHLRLQGLADLFLDAHPGEHGLDPRLHRRILANRAVGLGPEGGMNDRRGGGINGKRRRGQQSSQEQAQDGGLQHRGFVPAGPLRVLAGRA